MGASRLPVGSPGPAGTGSPIPPVVIEKRLLRFACDGRGVSLLAHPRDPFKAVFMPDAGPRGGAASRSRPGRGLSHGPAGVMVGDHLARPAVEGLSRLRHGHVFERRTRRAGQDRRDLPDRRPRVRLDDRSRSRPPTCPSKSATWPSPSRWSGPTARTRPRSSSADSSPTSSSPAPAPSSISSALPAPRPTCCVTCLPRDQARVLRRVGEGRRSSFRPLRPQRPGRDARHLAAAPHLARARARGQARRPGRLRLPVPLGRELRRAPRLPL